MQINFHSLWDYFVLAMHAWLMQGHGDSCSSCTNIYGLLALETATHTDGIVHHSASVSCMIMISTVLIIFFVVAITNADFSYILIIITNCMIYRLTSTHLKNNDAGLRLEVAAYHHLHYSSKLKFFWRNWSCIYFICKTVHLSYNTYMPSPKSL